MVGSTSTRPDEVARCAEGLGMSVGDVNPVRRRLVERLLAEVGRRRAPLEGARDHFLHRLHRRSEDFPATRGLRIVYDALARVGWSEDSEPTPHRPARAAPTPYRPRSAGGARRRERPRTRKVSR